jgi:acetyl-CoA carboxylase beta subunit
MAELTCAACGETGEPAAVERNVAVCSNCGVTLRVMADRTAVAIYDDVQPLDEAEMKRLKRARGAIVRPTRKQR